MPDLAAELWAVQHLASLCTINITNIRDAKTALGPVERGLDVVFDLDGRRVGAQHTIFHADEGQTPGKRGSLARAKEEATARATQAPFGVWGVADYRPALALRLQEKCAIAARHDTRDVVAQTWLVVSACLNRWGAAASTMIVPALVQTDELNGLFHGRCAAPGLSASIWFSISEASSLGGRARRAGGLSLIRTPGSVNCTGRG